MFFFLFNISNDNKSKESVLLFEIIYSVIPGVTTLLPLFPNPNIRARFYWKYCKNLPRRLLFENSGKLKGDHIYP